MNLDDWIDEVCIQFNIDIELDDTLLLDVAKDIANDVNSQAASVGLFLLGYAAAQVDGDEDEVQDLADVLVDVAGSWTEDDDDDDDDDDDFDYDDEYDLDDIDEEYDD